MPVAANQHTGIKGSCMMAEKDTQVAVVLNKSGEPMGVIDPGSIASGWLRGPPPKPKFSGGCTLLPTLSEKTASINEAFGMMRDRNVKCLLVTDHSNSLTGISNGRRTVTFIFNGTTVDSISISPDQLFKHA
ncbi:MAG: hypothetical protein MZV63_21755 [Marinilabiliales bacterium]|nr:hypothetical protein [Marinilabiliales bacterium]